MRINKCFQMPNAVKITGRTSSITNSFVNGIIPVIEPSKEEVNEALEILGMSEDSVVCAYCGDNHTEWDHLRPLVIGKQPTGYISEIHNLVPSCGKCNQSKGNQYWKDWMLSNAEKSPKTRNVPNLEEKIMRLEDYENWCKPIKVDFEHIVGKYKWNQHWENCKKIHNLMRESQVLSDEIKDIVKQALESNEKNLMECFLSNNSMNSHIKHTDNIKVKPLKIELSKNIDETKKVGHIVQTDFAKLLTTGNLSDDLIEWLQSKDYSKQIFNLNFPLLKKVDEKINLKKQIMDSNKINRYYTSPLLIKGTRYLLTSQWYDRNKEKLIEWINQHNTFCS